MITGMDHPWRRLRELTDWTLAWAHLDGALGVTDWRTKTITLDSRQTQRQRRSTICHEVLHVQRGPFHPAWEWREEAIVEQLAARRLITLPALADALAWSHNESEAADELWCDVALLQARLARLHPAERAYLRARLTHLHEEHTP